MKFSKVIGKCDPKIIKDAEDKLSAVFTELSLGWSNKSIGTNLGGDPLVFQLVYPLPHICDATSIQLDDFEKKEEEIAKRIAKGEIIPEEEKISEDIKHFRKQMSGKALRTAATDGRRYYWSPTFVNKISRIGLRLVVMHESYHSLYMHPSRRGSRHPRLWNISVDFKVNYNAMEDLKAREIRDYVNVFTKELGEFITLEEYASFLADPFHPPPRLAHFNPTEGLKKMADPAYQDPFGDKPPMYYADSALPDTMKRPENVYEYLLSKIPKCPVCGKLGKYKKPEEYKALEKQIKDNEEKKRKEKEKQDKKNKTGGSNKKADKGKGDPGASCNEPGHDHGEDGDAGEGEGKNASPGQGTPNPNGQPQPGNGGSCCGGEGEQSCGCPGCGGDDSEYVDPFGAGDTLDDHIDSDVSEEELGKRISDAMEAAKRMAGKIPGALEDELGSLIAPKITWRDVVRQQMLKKRQGVGRNDWTNPRNRPMFAGLYIPKKRDFSLNMLVAIDCSGSMGADDISFGLSQLQVLDDKAEMSIVPFDTTCYWDAMVKIRKADKENLMKARRKGLGGTMVGDVFRQYHDNVGKVDIVVVISDGFIGDYELDGITVPKETSVLWLVTSHNPAFKPKIGRVLHLRDERI